MDVQRRQPVLRRLSDRHGLRARKDHAPHSLQAPVLLLDSAPGFPSWLASFRDEASQLLRERAGLSWR